MPEVLAVGVPSLGCRQGRPQAPLPRQAAEGAGVREQTFHQFTVRLFDSAPATIRIPTPISLCDLKRLKDAIDFHVAPAVAEHATMQDDLADTRELLAILVRAIDENDDVPHALEQARNVLSEAKREH